MLHQIHEHPVEFLACVFVAISIMMILIEGLASPIDYEDDDGEW